MNWTLSLGDVLFVVVLLFTSGVSWGRMIALQKQIEKQSVLASTRSEKIEERLINLTSDLQRVIGGFEMHIREHPHHQENEA